MSIDVMGVVSAHHPRKVTGAMIRFGKEHSVELSMEEVEDLRNKMSSFACSVEDKVGWIDPVLMSEPAVDKLDLTTKQLPSIRIERDFYPGAGVRIKSIDVVFPVEVSKDEIDNTITHVKEILKNE